MAPPCDLCPEARASSARRPGLVECVCGQVYRAGVAHDGRLVPLVRLPHGGGPALLVFHADPDAPEVPRTSPRRPSPRAVEAAELVTVRALLAELRPFRGGPLGWGPEALPPDAPPATLDEVGREGRPVFGPLVRVAMRVQASPEVPSILPGAFRAQAELAALSPAEQRALSLWSSPRASTATLRWLQQHGTLGAGLPALYEAVALALGGDRVARWRALDAGSARVARRAWGRDQVRAAMAVWWNESTGAA